MSTPWIREPHPRTPWDPYADVAVMTRGRYGIDKGQHGLPLMHAEIKLDFAQQRDGSVLISRAYFNIEFIRQNRRSSISLPGPGEAELSLAAEL